MRIRIGALMFVLVAIFCLSGRVCAQSETVVPEVQSAAVATETTQASAVIPAETAAPAAAAPVKTVVESAKRGAIINAVKGEVVVMRSGGDKWIPAQVKMELSAGDKISSKKKARAEILLDDGTVIKLKENTTLEIQELGEEADTKAKKSLFKMLLGKLFAKVQPVLGGKFKITTPTAIAGVRGTEFALSVFENSSSELFVFDGEIEMMGQEGGQMWSMVVPAGQAMSTTPAGGQQPLREIKPEEKKEWKDFDEGKDEEAKKEEKKEEKPKEEEKVQAAAGPKNWGVDGGIGAVNLNGIMYYRVAIQPVFKIGKFKAALNLNVTWNDTNGFKTWEKEDWANLILYLQWAEKGEKPVYWRLGALDAATLGQGFIINRYANLTPKAVNGGYHNLGLEFDLDMTKWGFESLLNNILEPGLIGVRFFWRPLSGPFFENFTVGLTCASDINTGPAYIKSIADTVPVQEANTLIGGADMSLPIIGKFLIWYADGGWIINHGNGWASGFKGGAGPVTYRFEYRNLDSDFIPGYFNYYYEFSKPVNIPAHTGERANGWFGELTANILKFVSLGVYYEDARGSSGASKLGYPWIHGSLSLNSELFTTLFHQRISASISYDQRDLSSPATSQTAVAEGKLLYGISKNVDMIYVYTQRYSGTQMIRSSSVQTQIHF